MSETDLLLASTAEQGRNITRGNRTSDADGLANDGNAAEDAASLGGNNGKDWHFG